MKFIYGFYSPASSRDAIVRAMKLRSPAKINLWLKILGRRPDGFHELETLMLPLDLADQMRFGCAGLGIILKCDDPSLPTDGRNLVVRAALAMQKQFGVSQGVRITLRKRIPVGGGLGGGSSNAATTLRALNRLWGVCASEAELSEIAASLGSDVAFFLQSHPALCTGRGEQISPIVEVGSLPRCWFLLVNLNFGVATKWAYDHSGAKPFRREKVLRLPCLVLPSEVAPLARLLENSLEQPVFAKFPILAMLKTSLHRHGAMGVAMSGSGATMFGIVRSRAEGKRIAKLLRAEFGETLWTYVARCAI